MAEVDPDIRADIAQTIMAIHTDHAHGASFLAQQACDLALRVSGAGQVGSLPPDVAVRMLREVCRDLVTVRASMAPLVVVATLIGQAATGADAAQVLAAVAAVVHAIQATWRDAPTQIASQLCERLGQHERVVTLSRSAAVAQALRANADRIASVTILESRPAGEGVEFARYLAATGNTWQIEVVPDAACVLAAQSATCCIVGADALLPAGFAVNKTGTHPLALAAHAVGAPCYVLAETLKIAPAAWHWQGEVFAPELLVPTPIPGVTITAVAFERVPLALVTVLTEQGRYDATMIAARGDALTDSFTQLVTLP